MECLKIIAVAVSLPLLLFPLGVSCDNSEMAGPQQEELAHTGDRQQVKQQQRTHLSQVPCHLFACACASLAALLPVPVASSVLGAVAGASHLPHAGIRPRLRSRRIRKQQDHGERGTVHNGCGHGQAQCGASFRPRKGPAQQLSSTRPRAPTAEAKAKAE